MIKSKFIVDNDIVSLKPEQFRKIKSDTEKLYISLYKRNINVSIKNIKEFFLNNDKTILNCKILKTDTNISIYNNFIENYFYNEGTSIIEFSSGMDPMTGNPSNPYIGDSFEFLFIDEELILNILITNSRLKSK